MTTIRRDPPDASCGRCGEGFAHPNDIRNHTCAPSPLTRLLVWLGVRSECCRARTYQPTGWDRTYCAQCDGRLP